MEKEPKIIDISENDTQTGETFSIDFDKIEDTVVETTPVEETKIEVKESIKKENVKAPKEVKNKEEKVRTDEIKISTEAMKELEEEAKEKYKEAVKEKFNAKTESDRTYFNNKRLSFLQRCKDEPKVSVLGSKFYQQYFGPIYTFLLNGIPITIKFDGTKQVFPAFVATRLMEKLSEVADSNLPVEKNEKLETL